MAISNQDRISKALELLRAGMAPFVAREFTAKFKDEMISDRASSDYLAEIKSTSGFPFVPVLTSHGLPAAADSPLRRDDYEAFLSWRQEHLWQEIRRVTGATVAADLEADDEDLE